MAEWGLSGSWFDDGTPSSAGLRLLKGFIGKIGTFTYSGSSLTSSLGCRNVCYYVPTGPLRPGIAPGGHLEGQGKRRWENWAALARMGMREEGGGKISPTDPRWDKKYQFSSFKNLYEFTLDDHPNIHIRCSPFDILLESNKPRGSMKIRKTKRRKKLTKKEKKKKDKKEKKKKEKEKKDKKSKKRKEKKERQKDI